MKVAISSNEKDIDGSVSEVFGRCPYFIIAEIDVDIKRSKAMKNVVQDQIGSAGISAAQMIMQEHVDAVVTGNIGPRALDIFKQFNVAVYRGRGPIKDVLQDFIKGRLELIVSGVKK